MLRNAGRGTSSINTALVAIVAVVVIAAVALVVLDAALKACTSTYPEMQQVHSKGLTLKLPIKWQ